MNVSHERLNLLSMVCSPLASVRILIENLGALGRVYPVVLQDATYLQQFV